MKTCKKMAPITELIIALLILIIVGILFFTGSMDIKLGSNELNVNVLFYHDLELSYAEIDDIELRYSLDIGTRKSGIGTAKLSVGTFTNKEFGEYKLYSYTSAGGYIIIRTNDNVIVIGAQDSDSANSIFEGLMEKMSGDAK